MRSQRVLCLPDAGRLPLAEHLPWYSIMPCISTIANLSFSKTPHSSPTLSLQHPSLLTCPRRSCIYFHIISRATCLLHVTRIGDMPHPLLSGTCDMQSRSCLMQPAYQQLACCRIEASNTWTTASGILLCRMRRIARPAPVFAIRGACMTAMRRVRLYDYRHETLQWSSLVLNIGLPLSTGHTSLRDMHTA
jgi:hypothetical protein